MFIILMCPTLHPKKNEKENDVLYFKVPYIFVDYDPLKVVSRGIQLETSQCGAFQFMFTAFHQYLLAVSNSKTISKIKYIFSTIHINLTS